MKRFYIDAVEADGIKFLVGPFPNESMARKREIEVVEFAMNNGHMSPFSDFGVCSIGGGYAAPGKLNRFFEFAAGELIA